MAINNNEINDLQHPAPGGSGSRKVVLYGYSRLWSTTLKRKCSMTTTTTARAATAPAHPGTPGFPSVHPTARRRQAAGKVDLLKLAKREVLPVTLRELAALYQAANPDQYPLMLNVRKWLDDFGLGDVCAWDITREQLQAGATWMKDSLAYKAGSINRDLSQIGSLYRHAIATKICPENFTSPTLRLQREPEAARVVEPATPEEWAAIRREAANAKDRRFCLFVWLVMDTGCRRSEITERTWSEFSLGDEQTAPHLTLPGSVTKTGKPRRVYFSQETADLLRRLRPAEKYRGALAFTSTRRIDKPNDYRKPWARLTARIGRGGLHVHDLRHMVAADLLKRGEGVAQVAHALGNSARVLEARYGHLDDAHTQKMQASRLGTDTHLPPAELPAVVEARQRQARARRRRAPPTPSPKRSACSWSPRKRCAPRWPPPRPWPACAWRPPRANKGSANENACRPDRCRPGGLRHHGGSEPAGRGSRLRTPITCAAGPDCDAKWEAAQVWIVTHAGFKLQTATAVTLQTFGPSTAVEQSTSLAVTMIREPDGPGRYRIRGEMTCGNPFGCTPDRATRCWTSAARSPPRAPRDGCHSG